MVESKKYGVYRAHRAYRCRGYQRHKGSKRLNELSLLTHPFSILYHLPHIQAHSL
jgi:hypothetical protein